MRILNEPFGTLQRLKGNSLLLPVYAGVVAEARRSMDDWIPVTALAEFRKFVRRYGLRIAEDCIFEPLSTGRTIDALDRSPTTHSYGRALRDIENASPGATIHVFISRRADWAEEALNSLAYPVAIPQDRLLVWPRIDASRIGAAFGYPSCCIDVFLKWNNWRRQSHFSRTYNSTEDVDWRANCLTRNTPLMAIFHVPCETACSQTIEMSQKIVDAVGGFDSDYASAIEDCLKGVFLIVHEAFVYKLHGARLLGKNSVAFSRAELVVPLKRVSPPHLSRIAWVMEGANWVQVADGIIVTTRSDEERFYEVSPTADWIEDPCLVRFA